MRAFTQTIGVLALAAVLVLPMSATAARQEPVEDPLALVALLVSDGHWDRAASALRDIDEHAEDLDLARFHSLRGLVLLQQQDHSGAARAFQASADASPPGEVDPAIWLYLARALLLDERPDEALAALDSGGDTVDDFAGAWLVRARAEWTRGRTDTAWQALSTGADRFPLEPEFPRQQVLLLVDLGLTQAAAAKASSLLTREDTDVSDVLVVAEAMRRSGQLDTAALVLEQARLQHPGDVELLIRSAAVAHAAQQPLTAARFLQRATEQRPELAVETAELFRQAGRIELALYMNASVADPVEKVRQRFGILLDAEQFDRSAALAPRLSRLGLLDEDPVRYGLAYAHFRLGEHDRAETLLGGVRDAQVFRQATALRDAIASCRAQPTACL